MPRVSENKQLVEIILAFFDDLVEKYTIFEEVNMDSTSSSLFGGYMVESDEPKPSIGFKFEGFFIERKEFKNYIEIFIDVNNPTYTDLRGDELLKILLTFMDDFFENHLVIESKKVTEKLGFPKSGYRATKNREQQNVAYQISGIIPSREEIESQIRTFLHTKNLA